MTLYVHGRPEKQLRARRRALVVIVTLGLVAGCSAVLVRALARPPASAAGSVEPRPAATGLDPELLRRFDDAAAAAADDDVALTITSGWRTVAQQEQLVDDAVATYGSVAEAHRWVLPPEKSAHVQGRAIDVGPPSGAAWLGEHGAQFGLCRTYANEAWHFEPVIDPGGACPEPYPDSSVGW